MDPVVCNVTFHGRAAAVKMLSCRCSFGSVTAEDDSELMLSWSLCTRHGVVHEVIQVPFSRSRRSFSVVDEWNISSGTIREGIIEMIHLYVLIDLNLALFKRCHPSMIVLYALIKESRTGFEGDSNSK